MAAVSDSRPPVEMPPGRVLTKVALTFVTLTAVVGCLTVLFLCMRAVMDIGGYCASGGPYEIRATCPKGTGWMMFAAIWGGLLALGLYVGSDNRLPGPKWAGLAWPALFLSLGWNFWEYGLDPPGEGAPGTDWGWIICGILFVLMGGVPLVLALSSRDARRILFWSDAHTGADGRPHARDVARAARPPLRVRDVRAYATATPTGAAPTAGDPAANDSGGSDVGDLAEDLERLAALHEQGSLTDSEFRAAKARRISGGPQ